MLCTSDLHIMNRYSSFVILIIHTRQKKIKDFSFPSHIIQEQLKFSNSFKQKAFSQVTLFQHSAYKKATRKLNLKRGVNEHTSPKDFHNDCIQVSASRKIFEVNLKLFHNTPVECVSNSTNKLCRKCTKFTFSR